MCYRDRCVIVIDDRVSYYNLLLRCGIVYVLVNSSFIVRLLSYIVIRYCDIVRYCISVIYIRYKARSYISQDVYQSK